MAAETFGGATVVIDLGLARGEPDEYVRPVRSTMPDWFAPMILAVIVLLSSAASAAPPPPALSHVLTMSVGPGDPYTLTEGGDLLAQTYGRISAYSLGDGRLKWEAGSASPTYRLRTGGGLVLLRPWSADRADPGTTAISLNSGAAQWRRSGSIVTIAGSSTLLAVTGVRSMSGSGRRVQGPVDAIDPVSGTTRWQVDVPSTAVLLGVPGPAGQRTRMLLVHDDRTAAVHDLGTGALLASASMPPADYGPDNPVVSGGLLLLRHPTTDGRMVSAFDPVTLELRWSRPAGLAFGVTPCGDLACFTGPDGVRAVEPSSGAQRWFKSGWRSVDVRNGMVVAYGTAAGETDPVGVIDPATGAVLTGLHGWRPVPAPGGGDRMLVTRLVDGSTRTMVAVVGPGDARPELLADLPAGTGDCQAAPSRLVCRSTSGELIVWAYRQRG
ncbi:PQQ-binding-like beta-propeller repeat protein [Actinoplanes sp. NPDC026623]|uniref:outer membrane protein assembly factor BamB family protein n=1 Tax=Actinoplanes sp. NPDC026623 TaxID=3155610 RepID=UPI0033FC2E71